MAMATNKIDLRNQSISRLFFIYFIPSVCAMLALSTNATIDGIFVGQKVGANALAAVGIAWPLFPVMIAYELLFSIGGAALSSYYIGKGKPRRARIIFSSIFYFALISGTLIGILLFIFRYEMARFLGASDVLLPLVVEYIGVIFLGGIFIVLQPLLDIFAINDKRPNLAMFATIAASLLNIILNYIFIFLWGWGLFGAALATVLGNAAGFFVLLRHFVLRQGDIYFLWCFKIRAILVSAKNGIPQAVAEISVGLMMLAFNHALGEIAGERGISIYSILMYTGIIVFTVILSSAQSIQPIASFNYGTGCIKRIREIFLFALGFSLLLGVVMYGLSRLFAGLLVGVFVGEAEIMSDPNLLDDVAHAIGIYYCGFILLGISLCTAILLQAIQRPWHALLVTLSSSLLFAIPLVLVLPKFWGIDGIWWSYPLAMMASSLIALCVVGYEFHKGVLRLMPR